MQEMDGVCDDEDEEDDGDEERGDVQMSLDDGCQWWRVWWENLSSVSVYNKRHTVKHLINE